MSKFKIFKKGRTYGIINTHTGEFGATDFSKDEALRLSRQYNRQGYAGLSKFRQKKANKPRIDFSFKI